MASQGRVVRPSWTVTRFKDACPMTLSKPANTEFPVHTLIGDRWSPVVFEPRPVSSDAVGSLFEAARWAPSSYNDQPWSFVFAQREQTNDFQRLLQCLVEANQQWAKDAGLLVLSVARAELSRTGKPNKFAWHDVGAATQNLLLQATALGLHGHPMGGFDAAKAQADLQIPAPFQPAAMIAIGHLKADLTGVDQGTVQRQLGARDRRPLSELLHVGRWGVNWSK